MQSLVFEDSHAERASLRRGGARGTGLAWALGFLGRVLRGGIFGCAVLAGSVVAASVVACGGDDDGGETVVLANRGSITPLTSRTLAIPTTVAVRPDAMREVAWVAESQFDHYAPFGGVGDPGPFRIIGVPLAGDSTALSIALPANFFPEGIAASPVGRLYVGSVADGSIYTVGPTATTAEPFLAAGALEKPSVLGMAVNREADILWVCNTVTSAPMGTLPSAAIVGIGAGDRQIKATHELPASAAGAFCNDIVIADNGTLWATESFGGRLFRIPPAELLSNSDATAWLQASELAGPNGPEVNQFGANGLALVSGKLFVVNSSRGTLLSIDPTLAQPGSADLNVVELSEPDVTGNVLLANPDGVTRLSNTELLVVENGFFVENGMIVDRGGRRLVRVSLDTE